MEVTAHWSGGYRCRVPIRQHLLLGDEPPEVAGGTDTGPTPTELLLASLATCFTMSLAHVARRRGVELAGDLAVTAVGDYSGPSFVALRVEVRCSTPREVLEPLLGPAAGLCYVSNTLKRGPTVECVIAPS